MDNCLQSLWYSQGQLLQTLFKRESINNLVSTKDISLNKRSEFYSKCRHENKNLIMNEK